MTAFTPGMDRTLREEFEDRELNRVVLIERGSEIDSFVPSDREEWRAGDIIYHYPPWKDLGTETEGGGTLWQVRMKRNNGEVILTNLVGEEREDRQIDYLNKGISEGFITVAEPE